MQKSNTYPSDARKRACHDVKVHLVESGSIFAQLVFDALAIAPRGVGTRFCVASLEDAQLACRIGESVAPNEADGTDPF